MRLRLLRLMGKESGAKTSLSSFYIDKKPSCWMLEDQHRDVKVMGDTRFPAGHLEIVFRCFGRHYETYQKKHSDVHKTKEHGMLCVITPGNKEYKIITPNMTFQACLIHTGNNEKHTEGCLITGSSAHHTNIKGDLGVSDSTLAYKTIYPPIAEKLLEGERVYLDVLDEESLFNWN